MISDEDVVQLFRNIRDTPVDFTESDCAGRKRQIYRGVPEYLWKDAPPGGCMRHMAIFRKYSIVPKYCFDCYKVLITPRTVVELFKLLMIFEKIKLPLDNTRKCMVEVRDGVSGSYKGFIYCRGIVEGSLIRKMMQKVVSDEISPRVAVTLKRGCSPYAQVHPQYARTKPGGVIMQYKKEWQALEDAFDKEIVFHRNVTDDNSNVSEVNVDDDIATYTQWEIFCMQYWLNYAATIGDDSYMKLSRKTLP